MAYLGFHSEWFDEQQTLPWWQRMLEIRGQYVHVAGLNSAWMSRGANDRSRLLIGRYQINDTVGAAQAEGADWRLALMHHPWDYLAEFDAHEARQQIHLNCDLLLRGHLHQPHSERILPPDTNRECLELAAGCVYENSRYPNAFQWIELCSDPKRVRVLFRLWNQGAWQVDRNQPGTTSGVAQFDVEPDERTRAVNPAAPSVPRAYLSWLKRTYSGVELLGQDVQEGQALQLRQVYVPAVCEPEEDVRRLFPNLNYENEGTRSRNIQRYIWVGGVTMLLERLNAGSLYCSGQPGAGKSTFCRWAVLQSIPSAELEHPIPPPEYLDEPVPDDLRTRLPLLVPLREFWMFMDCGHGRRTWSREGLSQALADWVDQAAPEGLTGALLKAHLNKGTAFLLLDGLDEVPISEPRERHTVYPRKLLLSGLADALPVWETTGNRILLTSRPYGLDQGELSQLGLPSAPLLPLPEPLQALFVTRWFATLDKEELASGLLNSIRSRADLEPLAENPMLLTALCVI